MTILMGYKLTNGVVFTADMKRSDVTFEGLNRGTFNLSKKVHQIHPHMVIATAGLGAVGEAIANMLKSTIGINEGISATDALEFVSDAFQYSHNLFRRINPEVTYTNLVAMIGGYDVEKQEPYLYSISSGNNFQLIAHEESFIHIGPSPEILRRNFLATAPLCRDFLDIAKAFSAAIREVNSEDVSKETFSIASFYTDDEVYMTSSMIIDENGGLEDM